MFSCCRHRVVDKSSWRERSIPIQLPLARHPALASAWTLSSQDSPRCFRPVRVTTHRIRKNHGHNKVVSSVFASFRSTTLPTSGETRKAVMQTSRGSRTQYYGDKILTRSAWHFKMGDCHILILPFYFCSSDCKFLNLYSIRSLVQPWQIIMHFTSMANTIRIRGVFLSEYRVKQREEL